VGGERRRERKSLRNGVHHANAVARRPSVYSRTRLIHRQDVHAEVIPERLAKRQTSGFDLRRRRAVQRRVRDPLVVAQPADDVDGIPTDVGQTLGRVGREHDDARPPGRGRASARRRAAGVFSRGGGEVLRRNQHGPPRRAVIPREVSLDVARHRREEQSRGFAARARVRDRGARSRLARVAGRRRPRFRVACVGEAIGQSNVLPVKRTLKGKRG